MRKLFFCITFICGCSYLFAQECTTTWPYLYSDFSNGKVYYKSGKTESKFLNIHVLENRLHFIDGENINELKSTNNIAKVEIIKNTYIPVGEKFYQIISEGSGGYLVLLVSGDYSSLSANTGAYGSSSNSIATNKLSSLPDRFINHMELRNNKNNGENLPLIKKYFFVTGGEIITAKAKDVEKSLSDAQKQKEFKAFVKANKINWNKPDDLAKVLTIL